MNNLNRFLSQFARTILASLLLCSAGGVSAQDDTEYYTWVDENGVTNYAERNPEGISATFVGRDRAFGRPSNAFPQEATTPIQFNDPSSAIDPDLLVEESAAVLAAELAETKRRNCDIGKNNLAQLRAFARIRVSDDLGENRILTDDEKAVKAEEARQVIRENCSG